MFRIIKYGLEDYTYMMKKLNLSAVELLGLWWLVFDLESAADELKRISRYMKIVKLDKKKEEEFLELLKRVKVNYLAMMKAYYDPNIKGVHEILNGREKLFNDIEEYYKKNKAVEGVGFMTHRVKAISAHVNHIGRRLYQLSDSTTV